MLRFLAVPLCSVSFTDAGGFRHSVEVQAESLYEAAVLAFRAFKKAQWIEHIAPSAPLEISVHAPVAKHTLTLRQVESWIDGSSKSPGEMTKKDEAEGTAYRSLTT